MEAVFLQLSTGVLVSVGPLKGPHAGGGQPWRAGLGSSHGWQMDGTRLRLLLPGMSWMCLIIL